MAILDFGESRCDVLDADFAKCDERFPPYVDLVERMLSLSNVLLSGVKGDVLLVAVRTRGEGVRGIRPPAVREEKSPMWDLMGVDTAVAILQYRGNDLGRKTNKCIDR